METAYEAGYRMPAEWEPHERCWMAWPTFVELWGEKLVAAQAGYAGVAKAIARFEPVTMLVPPHALATARKSCGPSVDVLEIDLDDSWTRDSGPNFVKKANGGLAASIFHFNAWGGKYERFRKDAALGHRLAEHLGIRTFSSPLFMEGGGINVDGEGTLLTTEQCVLNANRNPGITKAEAEQEFLHALGVEKVIWLAGDPDDQETDGHVDGIACFVRPGVVMVEVCPDEDSHRYAPLNENLEILRDATDAKGRPLEVITVNEAHEAQSDGRLFCRSYINFYLANGAVIVPGYGIERDTEFVSFVEQAFPDRTVVQVDVTGIAVGGGGIHCITQQQPV